MKKILFFALSVFLILPALADVEEVLEKNNKIQTKIDEVGTNLLNLNKITKRIIFSYSDQEKKKIVLLDKTITKRQVVIYQDLYQYTQTDDELAAMLAREISLAVKSYDGAWGGRIDALQIALSPKKFEIVDDKRAVDYLVKAGYNPLALIVFINKSCHQARGDKISRTNLTSKRLAIIYEYITYKYPQYLENNEYIKNPYYQNFLLTSVENRKKLENKIKAHSKETLKYE